MNYKINDYTGEIYSNVRLNYKIPVKPAESSKEIPTYISPLPSITTNPITMAASQSPSTVPLVNLNKSSSKKRNKIEPLPDLHTGLPVELKEFLQPLKCGLCNAEFNSTHVAKFHYESKTHDKKINNWLSTWSKNTGEPVPKRARILDTGPVGPNAFHCDLCDLDLTSTQHAQQHYAGKKHKMTLAGRTKPSGSGHYDDNGKWVRINTKIKYDESGRFGIGESFLATKSISESTTTNTITSTATYCSFCDVTVTSEPQMKLHLEGGKHLKKIKSVGNDGVFSESDTIMNTILKRQSDTQPISNIRDTSIYRTPSGSYYCKPCDLTIPSEQIFQQHLNGKKHLKSMKKT